MNSSETSIKPLTEAVAELHGCEAVWIESVPVRQVFRGKTLWEGEVQVFDLNGNPRATRCYAWFHPVDDSGKRKFFTVLHQGSVDSPLNAVRAAIAAE